MPDYAVNTGPSPANYQLAMPLVAQTSTIPGNLSPSQTRQTIVSRPNVMVVQAPRLGVTTWYSSPGPAFQTRATRTSVPNIVVVAAPRGFVTAFFPTGVNVPRPRGQFGLLYPAQGGAEAATVTKAIQGVQVTPEYRVIVVYVDGTTQDVGSIYDTVLNELFLHMGE